MNRSTCFPLIEDPIFIPYLGDDKPDGASMLSEHEVEMRKKATEEGPLMERDETNALLDHVLSECSVIDGIHVYKHAETTNYVLFALARAACLTLPRVQDRYRVTIVPMYTSQNEEESSTVDANMERTAIQNPLDASVCGECVSEETLDNDAFDTEYLQDMDSFRAMFCRRCFTYCCSVHGLEEKPSLNVQLQSFLGAEESRKFSSLGVDIDAETWWDDVTELSSFQKTMCKRAFAMCHGDYRRISFILGAPEHLIKEFVQENGFQLPPEASSLKPRANTKMNNKYSVKNYNQKWYNAIKDAEIHPFFTPCCHEGLCSDKNCSCIQNRFFCTPACCWGALSPNFFRGCGCKGNCNASNCTCFAAKRECDPELCSCFTCIDPPDRPAFTQVCRNDNIRMRRHAHLLLAPSTISGSGWGCFTKNALKKGDFIHVYVGEMTKQEVAEKRGQIDDAKNRSYLFNLSSDYALDACRTGNKTRFINHSNKPNVEGRTVFVNGDQHVALFAFERIDAEAELFFDYRYNVYMNNDLIEKATYKPDWLPSDAIVSTSKKPNTGKRKRRKR